MGKNGNKVLAHITKEIQKELDLPLVLQWEIADNIQGIPLAMVVREHHKKGIYLDTREVLFQAREFCKKQGWKRAIIVAHADHLWRGIRTAEKLGFEVVGVPDTSRVPYDEPWNRLRFMLREIFIARPLYLFRAYL